MPTLSPVRLLIADRSENRAHEIDSVLRNAGIPTRAEFCADLSEISDPEQPIDLLLCRSHFDHLEQVLPGLRKLKPNLPIIVMDDSPEPKNLTRGLAIGATDVIINNDNERLLHVVKRELEYVSQRDRFSQTQRALQEAERRCELLLANSTAAIAYVHEGMHIYANDDYFKLFGFTDVDELLGLPLLDLMDASFADDFRAKIKTFRDDSADELSFSFCGRTTEGIPIAGQMSLTGAVYEGEHCTQVLVRSQAVPVLRDVLPAVADDGPPELVEVASVPTPAETSVATTNGAGADAFALGYSFISDIEQGAARPGAMLAIEIDDFDALQVEIGLDRAENMVGQIADALTAELGGSRMARIANHRFAVATVGASEAGGDVLAERLRETVEGGLFEVDGKTVRRTITIGASVLGDTGNIGDAMNLAFRTLVSSRRSGKSNCISWPTVTVVEAEGNATGLTSEQRRILKLVNDAIENQTFVLLFQPIISLRGDSDEHYEVFLRLLDEKSRRLPPDQFLQLAIDNGVAAKIDRWVILQSIKALSQHRSKGHNTRLTINLTCNSLIDEDFISWLGVAIKAARLPSDAVIFQIAEPDASTYVRQAREFVQGLKAIHCRTSLRHFGTTDNPFETLRHVPVDFVKLDGNHVQKVDGDQARKEKLTAMIRELQQHGKLTVIPMVESATVLSALWQAGANYIQGHYLQEPSTEMNYDFAADD
jgi:EAL domain-containing protein (putative c-di-GMP-specific phosphodiesterase class I)/GGDEF domain-containing protein/PAS domain-containing protein